MLVETTGIFADTTRLCDLMNHFASDFIGADWNMYETYFVGGEDSEKTITNLGAYVEFMQTMLFFELMSFLLVEEAISGLNGEVLPENIGSRKS